MLEYKTQIIKLQNGTDLIANVTATSLDRITLEEPMEFQIDYRGKDTGLIMNHWLPVQLVKRNSVEIFTKDVLSILDPDEEFCEYYINTVSRIKGLIKAKNEVTKMSEEEITQMINEFEDLPSNGDTLH
jgi:SAM-dependent MidA family methyltransferase